MNTPNWTRPGLEELPLKGIVTSRLKAELKILGQSFLLKICINTNLKNVKLPCIDKVVEAWKEMNE